MKNKDIYVNKINKKIDNNQNYCDVDNNEIIENTDVLSVDDKIKKLFDTNGYVFNVDVKIITSNKTYNTRIAGRVGNNIITLDNDIININDINNIIY